jgi:hypothetical protein
MLIKYGRMQPNARQTLLRVNTSAKLAQVIENLNSNIIPAYLNEDQDLEEIHMYVYTAAITAISLVGGKILEQQIKPKIVKEDRWEKRLTNKTYKLRRELALITAASNPHNNRKTKKEIRGIRNKYTIHMARDRENVTDTEIIDTIRQKLAATVSRYHRYKTSQKRRQDNKNFKNNKKRFYAQLVKKKAIPEDAPTGSEIENFRNSIWSNDTTHKQTTWLNEVQFKGETMEYKQITEEEIGNAIKKINNWKAPGPDKIQNFWWKKFTVVHPFIANQFSKIIEDPTQVPSFLTIGNTYLISKDPTDCKNPAKYCPITCLPTIYKIPKSCIAEKIHKHIYDNNIVAEQQKGCIGSTRGCKE